MIAGILVGAASVLLLGLLAALTDPGTRHDLAEVVLAVLGIPVAVIIMLALPVARRAGSMRVVRPDTLRRYINRIDAGGIVMHRPMRSVVIFTDTRHRSVRTPVLVEPDDEAGADDAP